MSTKYPSFSFSAACLLAIAIGAQPAWPAQAHAESTTNPTELANTIDYNATDRDGLLSNMRIGIKLCETALEDNVDTSSDARPVWLYPILNLLREGVEYASDHPSDTEFVNTAILLADLSLRINVHTAMSFHSVQILIAIATPSEELGRLITRVFNSDHAASLDVWSLNAAEKAPGIMIDQAAQRLADTPLEDIDHWMPCIVAARGTPADISALSVYRSRYLHEGFDTQAAQSANRQRTLSMAEVDRLLSLQSARKTSDSLIGWALDAPDWNASATIWAIEHAIDADRMDSTQWAAFWERVATKAAERVDARPSKYRSKAQRDRILRGMLSPLVRWAQSRDITIPDSIQADAHRTRGNLSSP